MSTTPPPAEQSDGQYVDAPAQPPRPDAARGEPPRIRFMGLGVNRAPSGRLRATVTLEGVDGRRSEGAADVEPSAAGDLRAGAAATLAALHHAAGTGHRFSLLGVKSVRAFDRHVVLVQLGFVPAGGADGPLSLVGSAFSDGDLMRATVLAVLNASNRVLWTPGRS